jgi:site-specific DNA-methyltransferase (adenine-specific)
VCGDWQRWVPVLPPAHVDLLILDPPYNLDKTMGDKTFRRRSVEQYEVWLDHLLTLMRPLLKGTATVYICADWLTSLSVYTAAARHLNVRNRITWEREKGRAASMNWKNCTEDIWFCTVSDNYTFHPERVKLRRRVVAPYTDEKGAPKDWVQTNWGRFRDTHPSNLWTDITVPFWSMPENTDHPAQKSEKLIAKLMLASSDVGDFVFDPFLGSGTTSVVAKKLARRCLGIEDNEEYCLWAERRLELADEYTEIQGLAAGVFWERNSLGAQKAMDYEANGHTACQIR